MKLRIQVYFLNDHDHSLLMKNNRTTLIQTIKELQRLIPSDDYSEYLKQAQLKYLQYIPPHRFLPAMDEKSPKSLNDVELNVLSKAKSNYLNNVFMPTIAEKQPEILKDSAAETKGEAIDRWVATVKQAKTPAELMRLINTINQRKKRTGSKRKPTSFWKKIFGL